MFFKALPNLENSFAHSGYLSLFCLFIYLFTFSLLWQLDDFNTTLTEKMINIIQTAAYRFWHFRPVPSLLRSAAEIKQKRVSNTKMTWAPRDCTSLCAFLGSEKEEKRVSVTWSLLKPGGGQTGAPSRDCKLGVLSADHEGSDVMVLQSKMRCELRISTSVDDDVKNSISVSWSKWSYSKKNNNNKVVIITILIIFIEHFS